MEEHHESNLLYPGSQRFRPDHASAATDLPPRSAQTAVWELFAQAGSEAQPLSLRPGMVDLLRAAAASEVDVLMVLDVEHLHCGQAELDGLLMSLLQYGIHTFGAKNGQWIEPGGRHWMILPGYDEIDE